MLARTASTGHGAVLRHRPGPPLALAAAGVVSLAALHLRSPHVGGSWGVCPTLLLTGYACPGCGGLRAAYDLSHGDVLAALGSNAWAVALAPVALVVWGRWLRRGVRGAPRTGLGRADLWLLLAVVVSGVAFAVLRNLPVGAWFAP